MPELNEVKTGWVSMQDAATISGVARPNIYYYINLGRVRARADPSGKLRRQVRIDDLLAAVGKSEVVG